MILLALLLTLTPKAYVAGYGAEACYIFEPDPLPATAPVVVFLHGWNSVDYRDYWLWIDHLVSKGHIVLFPVYQDCILTPPANFVANAFTGIRNGLVAMHTKFDGRLHLVGHSAGGNLAAQLAAVLPLNGLPVAQSVVIAMPGRLPFDLPVSLRAIPATTRLTVVVGDSDRLVGWERGRQIVMEASSVPQERKRFLLLASRLGLPADHRAPYCRSFADALDVTLWNLTDQTIEGK